MAVRISLIFSIVGAIYLALNLNGVQTQREYHNGNFVPPETKFRRLVPDDDAGDGGETESSTTTLDESTTEPPSTPHAPDSGETEPSTTTLDESTTELPTTPHPPNSDHCDRNCSRGGVHTCEYKWTVEYSFTVPTLCPPEHCTPLYSLTRPLITVNDQMPGPAIIVCQNDTIRVEVTNLLQDDSAITIHWHGLRQYHTPGMDGVPMVTQYPILSGTTFTYEMKADVGGTYFWHSHVGASRADGLAGPLIVREKDDPQQSLYKEDSSDHIIFVQEGVNTLQFVHYLQYLYEQGPNRGDFLQINDKNKFLNEREIFNVEKGNTYRMRLINNAFSGCELQLSIDDHTLEAIAMDGYPIKSQVCGALVVNAGERIDFVFTADRDPKDYWLRLRGIGKNCQELKLQQLAILRYESVLPIKPTEDEDYKKFNTFETACNVPMKSNVNAEKIIRLSDMESIASLSKEEIKKRVEDPYYLELAVKDVPNKYNGRRLPRIHDISFKVPPYPLLTGHSEINNDLFFYEEKPQDASDATCGYNQNECIHTIEAALNEEVELFFFNPSNGSGCHPMHLHGHTFNVVGMGKLEADEKTLEEIREKDKDRDGGQPSFPRNLLNPVYKDTACVGAQSYMIIRFIADNPGWWFLHCHMEYHTLLGMAMTVHVGDENEVQEYLPKDSYPPCPKTRESTETNSLNDNPKLAGNDNRNRGRNSNGRHRGNRNQRHV